ncbi:MAG: hypothetical protein KJ630_22815 [Proteobacteria bacterium]|nr:hypothetical protein [Pseudomonadota bacterium]
MNNEWIYGIGGFFIGLVVAMAVILSVAISDGTLDGNALVIIGTLAITGTGAAGSLVVYFANLKEKQRLAVWEVNHGVLREFLSLLGKAQKAYEEEIEAQQTDPESKVDVPTPDWSFYDRFKDLLYEIKEIYAPFQNVELKTALEAYESTHIPTYLAESMEIEELAQLSLTAIIRLKKATQALYFKMSGMKLA